MKVIGIDSGGTNTQVVLVSPKKIEYLLSESNSHAIDLVKKRAKEFASCPVAITGGEAKKINKIFKEAEIIDEINSIGIGAAVLTKKKRLFVVNIGTGTAMVAVDRDDITHIGGTGLGGGFLSGFSRLILKSKNLKQLERLAQSGERAKVDLTVRDIVGSAVGNIPAAATASNFGKLSSTADKDLAAGLLNMLAESIASLAFFAAKTCALQQEIVFCGKVAENRIIRKRLKETVKMWGGKAMIPFHAEYACSIGAATIMLKNNT